MIRVTTMAEVDRLPPSVRLLAGGTDLLVQRREGLVDARLADVSSLRDAPPAVERHGDVLRLSAVASLTDVAAALGSALPALRAAIACFASLQIRNRATLGGNLANASPAADCVPPLVAAGATARLRRSDGRRDVPVEELATAPRSTCLRAGEWIETVDVPLRYGEHGFRKVVGRRALAISTVNLAWSWRRQPDGGVREVRLAAGAVAPVVVRCRATEGVLDGAAPSTATLAAAASALRDDTDPIDDQRGSAEYRQAALHGALTEALGDQFLIDQKRGT